MTLLLVLACLGSADDASDIQATVDRFFLALSKEDATTLKACWSEKSPGGNSFLKELRPGAHPGAPVLRELKISEGEASFLLRFEGHVLQGEALYTDETESGWRVILRQEDGRWRWWTLEPSAAGLARDLLERGDAKDRRALLDSRRQDIGLRLLVLLRDEGRRRSARPNSPPGGDGGFALALEAADLVQRDDLRAWVHLEQGIAELNQGRTAEAVLACRKAAQCAATLTPGVFSSRVHAILGQSLAEHRELAEATREAGLAREQAERTQDGESIFFAQRVNGRVFRLGGSTNEAVDWDTRARTTAKGLGRPDLEAEVLVELADLQWMLGNYEEAISAASAGLDLELGSEDLPFRANLLNTMGLVYFSCGDFHKARLRFEASLEVAATGSLARLRAGVLCNLAEMSRREGLLPEAGRRLSKAVETLEGLGDRLTALHARNNLGCVLLDQGDLHGAMAQFVAVMEKSRDLGDLPLQVQARLNAAAISLKQGNLLIASMLSSEALRLAKVSKSVPAEIQARYFRGACRLLRKGPKDLQNAVEDFEGAVKLLHQLRGGLRDPLLQQGYLAEQPPLFELLAQLHHALGNDVEAFQAAEEGKARTLMDLLQSNSVRITRSMSPEEIREEARLDGDLGMLSRRLGDAVLTQEREDLEQRVSAARVTLEELRHRIYALHPELQNRRARFAPASPQDLQIQLLSKGPRTAILSYTVTLSETMLFVVCPAKSGSTVVVHRIPIELAALQTRIDELWGACSVDRGNYHSSARDLYDLLIAPAEPSLGGIEHLVIIPDKLLYGLPFQALQDPSGRHLVELWGLRYAQSATALLKMEDLAEARRSAVRPDLRPILAAGAPEMPPDLIELLHAKEEVEAVALLFKESALTGPAATKTEVLKRLPGARRILIATHGKVDEVSPFYSYLVLGRDGIGDGRLHAREIADMDLSADLCVLSACETALGKQVRGEGVVGFSWSIFSAGVPSAVLSLWQVADDSTTELMREFHARMVSGASVAEALSQAQRALLKDPRWSHPYYWAPFILIGAGRG